MQPDFKRWKITEKSWEEERVAHYNHSVEPSVRVGNKSPPKLRLWDASTWSWGWTRTNNYHVLRVHKFFLTRTKLARECWESTMYNEAVLYKLGFMLEEVHRLQKPSSENKSIQWIRNANFLEWENRISRTSSLSKHKHKQINHNFSSRDDMSHIYQVDRNFRKVKIGCM